jgi:hypothetical protein
LSLPCESKWRKLLKLLGAKRGVNPTPRLFPQNTAVLLEFGPPPQRVRLVFRYKVLPKALRIGELIFVAAARCGLAIDDFNSAYNNALRQLMRSGAHTAP